DLIGFLVDLLHTGSETIVGKLENVSGATQYGEPHFLSFEVDRWGDNDDVNHAFLQRSQSSGIRAKSENFDVCFRIKAEMVDHHPRYYVRRRAIRADSYGFTFEVFDGPDFRFPHQRQRSSILGT